MTEQLIKFTPGKKPDHVDDDLIERRSIYDNKWRKPAQARYMKWYEDYDYRFHYHAHRLTDEQLEAEAKRRE